MELHHRCERHACWNPDHLELVTHAQNLAHTRKTHCKHGHPLAGANLYLAPGGLRKCRECNRAASGRFRRGIAPRGPLVSDPPEHGPLLDLVVVSEVGAVTLPASRRVGLRCRCPWLSAADR